MRQAKVSRFIVGNSTYVCDEPAGSVSLGNSIYIATSPWFIGVASAMYLGIGIALFLISWSWWLCLVFLLLLIVDYRRVIYLYGLRSHKFAVTILRQDCDKWLYQLHSGKCYSGKLQKSGSFCCRLFIVLYLRHLLGGRFIIIPRDALSEHNYRFLAFKLHCL